MVYWPGSIARRIVTWISNDSVPCAWGWGWRSWEGNVPSLFCSFWLLRHMYILLSPKNKNEMLQRHFANWSLNTLNKDLNGFDENSEMKPISDSVLKTRPWVQGVRLHLFPTCVGAPGCRPKRKLQGWAPAPQPVMRFPLFYRLKKFHHLNLRVMFFWDNLRTSSPGDSISNNPGETALLRQRGSQGA